MGRISAPVSFSALLKGRITKGVVLTIQNSEHSKLPLWIASHSSYFKTLSLSHESTETAHHFPLRLNLSGRLQKRSLATAYRDCILNCFHIGEASQTKFMQSPVKGVK